MGLATPLRVIEWFPYKLSTKLLKQFKPRLYHHEINHDNLDKNSTNNGPKNWVHLQLLRNKPIEHDIIIYFTLVNRAYNRAYVEDFTRWREDMSIIFQK